MKLSLPHIQVFNKFKDKNLIDSQQLSTVNYSGKYVLEKSNRNPIQPQSILKLQQINRHLRHSDIEHSIDGPDKETEDIKGRVWLIRKIGDLLNQDNRSISAKQKRLKRRQKKSYRKLNRQADMILKNIKQQNCANDKQIRQLRLNLL